MRALPGPAVRLQPHVSGIRRRCVAARVRRALAGPEQADAVRFDSRPAVEGVVPDAAHDCHPAHPDADHPAAVPVAELAGGAPDSEAGFEVAAEPAFEAVPGPRALPPRPVHPLPPVRGRHADADDACEAHPLGPARRDCPAPAFHPPTLPHRARHLAHRSEPDCRFAPPVRAPREVPASAVEVGVAADGKSTRARQPVPYPKSHPAAPHQPTGSAGPPAVPCPEVEAAHPCARRPAHPSGYPSAHHPAHDPGRGDDACGDGDPPRPPRSVVHPARVAVGHRSSVASVTRCHPPATDPRPHEAR